MQAGPLGWEVGITSGILTAVPDACFTQLLLSICVDQVCSCQWEKAGCRLAYLNDLIRNCCICISIKVALKVNGNKKIIRQVYLGTKFETYTSFFHDTRFQGSVLWLIGLRCCLTHD